MTADDVVGLLSTRRFRFTCETDLQNAIAETLPTAKREHRLSERDRADFLVDGVAVEVKVDGSLGAVTRQLFRYARHETVKAIVLVTSRAKHLRMPRSMVGKPVRTVFVGTL